MMRRCFPIILVLLLALLGCKPGVPDDILPMSEMEDILYDYHIAEAMVEAGNDNGADLAVLKRTYQLSALQKHGTTEAEFDSSLVYYATHADKLHKIYENISKRLGDEASLLGVSQDETNKYGVISQKGDTTDLWQKSRFLVVAQNQAESTITFALTPDTAYHAGDRFVLSFDAHFIFQDGIRDGVAMLTVTFQNDSTASQYVHCSSDMHYSLSVSDSKRLGIKKVRGFITLLRQPNATTSTLNLMFLDNLKLVRMHTKEQPTAPSNTTVKQDTLNRPQGQGNASASPSPTPTATRHGLNHGGQKRIKESAEVMAIPDKKH